MLKDFESDIEPIVADKYRELWYDLKKLPITNENYGLIHADLHYGNFLVEKDKLCVLDTDDCHYCWFAFDLAMPLLYVLRNKDVKPDDNEFAVHFLQEMIKGYNSENKFQSEWLEYFPLFMKLRELDLYSVLMHEGAEVVDNWDGWCQRFMDGRLSRIKNDIPVIDLDFRTVLG